MGDKETLSGLPADTFLEWRGVRHGEVVELKSHNENPSSYLKPLDIVKVAKCALGEKYYHFGIYLGNNQVYHYSDPDSKMKTDNNRVRITSWEIFVRECMNGEVVGYHPIIPFKTHWEIARNIAWDEYNNYGNLRYCLVNNNCETYVNSRVLGLNWSEQVAERPSEARENAHYWITTKYEKCSKCKSGMINRWRKRKLYLKKSVKE
ncbi:MAG: hypothetical protein MRERC_3c039 [Mycoplasmataceae bacterium RC_NB112A]|nr:MAG: hypothetical protein MRERC_3c039 [Mycoplasmataceae bacterium RC_NB112A]